ncbi:hypothetical protein XELAEV_18020326mg [Xenopus laevis]|uniref:Uncharacterized protein n=1 Tax=Xenopus laevis TaxID=8355 RepID=A0A974HQE2_XENLA|nr:hypothetical protein XELAEV_18020326mg [Xenopus laevis]
MKVDLLQPKIRQPTFFGNTRVGTFPCLSCGCCNSIIKGDSFNHSSKGYNIKLHDFATCTTTWVIYMLKCPCGKAYVGKTKHDIRTRIGPLQLSIEIVSATDSEDTPRGGDYNCILLQRK